MANESEITRKVCLTLSACGAKCTALVAGMMQSTGLPDRHVAHQRFVGFLEAKMNGAELTRAQNDNARAFMERGCPVIVITYWPSANKFVMRPWVAQTDGKDGALVDAAGQCIVHGDLKLATSKTAKGGHELLVAMSWIEREARLRGLLAPRVEL